MKEEGEGQATGPGETGFEEGGNGDWGEVGTGDGGGVGDKWVEEREAMKDGGRGMCGGEDSDGGLEGDNVAEGFGQGRREKLV